MNSSIRTGCVLALFVLAGVGCAGKGSKAVDTSAPRARGGDDSVAVAVLRSPMIPWSYYHPVTVDDRNVKHGDIELRPGVHKVRVEKHATYTGGANGMASGGSAFYLSLRDHDDRIIYFLAEAGHTYEVAGYDDRGLRIVDTTDEDKHVKQKVLTAKEDAERPRVRKNGKVARGYDQGRR